MTAAGITRIAVVGAGLVGRAWAIVFARAGFDVAVYDESAATRANVATAIRSSLEELIEYKLLDESVDTVLERILVEPSLEGALEGAGYVQESVVENVEEKRAVHGAIAAIAAPGTIQASSTSGIPASQWSAGLANRAYCLVAHPINPPHVVPIVEVCGAPWTSPEVVERVAAFQKAAGQSPVVLRKEVNGFVVNRLQGALLSEAFRLYADGVASAEDIDKTIRDGLGLRWSFMGPFETIDLNAPGGIADYCARFGPLYYQLAREATAQAWGEGLVSAIEAERRKVLGADALKARSAWRDRRLMGLMGFKRG